MSEEYDAGVVAGKAEERAKVLDAIVANPNLVAECTFVNASGKSIFMTTKFTAIIDGTWVDPVVPDEEV
jgi:hypothetical protein